ncbi:MAG: hypothetical protein GY835_06445 [bacterium]|nr:hypothetical protein [bacterium]
MAKDKAKTFMFVSIGILALVAAFQMGVTTTKADFEPDSPTIVGFDYQGSDWAWVLLPNGEFWKRSRSDSEWSRVDILDPPIPINEITHWGYKAVVATNGDVWMWDSYDSETWENWGSPNAPVPASETSTSDVKAMFRR